jgi:DNA-directed RNA polymerase sigma subunit (sigma70/sigma32)
MKRQQQQQRQRQQQRMVGDFRCCGWTIMAMYITTVTLCNIIGYSDSYVLLPPQFKSQFPSAKTIKTTTTTTSTRYTYNNNRGSSGRLWGSRIPHDDDYDNDNHDKKKKQHKLLKERRLAAKDYIKITTNLKKKNKNKAGVVAQEVVAQQQQLQLQQVRNKKNKIRTKARQRQLSSLTASYQLLDHEILTKSNEYELGMKIRNSVDLIKKIDIIIASKKRVAAKEEEKQHTQKLYHEEQKQLKEKKQKQEKKIKFQKRKAEEERQREQRRRMMKIYCNESDDVDDDHNNNINNRNKNRNMSMEEELEELLMSRKGSSSSSSSSFGTISAAAKNKWYGDIDEDEDDDNIMMEELGMAIYGIDYQDQHEHEHEQEHQQLQNHKDDEEEEDFFDDDDEDESANDRHNINYNNNNIMNSSSSNNIRTRVSPSQIGYSLDDIRMYLTEDEIINDLGIDGGSSELTSILIKGALAKQKMIKSNIRLVTSISKKWFRNAPNNGEQNFYAGSWTTPAMDEVIQQGIIGLAMAAERFEPERNFKFSTYATYYITNEVRKIFQSTTTGCLYVPQHYFVIRNKYQKLSKEYYRETGLSMDIEQAAKKLNLKIPRLQFVLKSTQSLLELDSPIAQGENGAGKAGGNQGGAGDSGTSTYSDTLKS